MNTLIIEHVTNGWLVRPFEPGDFTAYRTGGVHVYTTVKALQKDLPKLLADNPKTQCHEPVPSQEEHCASGIAADDGQDCKASR